MPPATDINAVVSKVLSLCPRNGIPPGDQVQELLRRLEASTDEATLLTRSNLQGAYKTTRRAWLCAHHSTITAPFWLGRTCKVLTSNTHPCFITVNNARC